MKPIREIINERMIELMEYAIDKEIVADRADWCDKIGFSYRGFSQIYSGKQGFTDEQKIAAVQLTGANMNWIFGLEPNRLRKTGRDPIEQIREALDSLERSKKR